MKTAFSLMLTRANYRRLLPFIKEAGFDGVEPIFHPEGMPSPAYFQEEAELLKKEADRLQLEIPSLRGGPLFWALFGSSNKEERKRAVLVAEQALAALKIMAGDTLLIVPGMWKKGQSYRQLYQNCLQTAEEVAEAATEADLMVGLENVENKFLLSPLEWCQFIDRIDSPHLQIYFDAGNPLNLGLGQPEDWIPDLGKRIICVHFKDSDEKKREIVPLGEGNVDWPAVVCALKKIGYDGYIGAELPLPGKNPRLFLLKTRQTIQNFWWSEGEPSDGRKRV